VNDEIALIENFAAKKLLAKKTST